MLKEQMLCFMIKKEIKFIKELLLMINNKLNVGNEIREWLH